MRSIEEGTLISLDSNEFVAGFTKSVASSALLLEVLYRFTLKIPHLVERETVKNLQTEDFSLVREFYGFIYGLPNFSIVYDPVPEALVEKYNKLGLSEEDSVIAGFVEWVSGKYLITENRHFLKGFHPDKFEVVNSETFLNFKIIKVTKR